MERKEGAREEVKSIWREERCVWKEGHEEETKGECLRKEAGKGCACNPAVKTALVIKGRPTEDQIIELHGTIHGSLIMCDMCKK